LQGGAFLFAWMKRYHLLVSGRVQGVGFRWYVKDLARKQNLAGWVRNLSSGQVEIIAEGEEKDWVLFLQGLKKGYLGGNIQDMEIQEEAPAGEFQNFEIKFF